MSMENVPSPEEADRRRLGFGAIASLGGVAALAVFMLQNTNDVKVEFLFWDFEWPVWLLTLVSALVGALVWFGMGVLRRHRRRQERRDDRRDLRALPSLGLPGNRGRRRRATPPGGRRRGSLGRARAGWRRRTPPSAGTVHRTAGARTRGHPGCPCSHGQDVVRAEVPGSSSAKSAVSNSAGAPVVAFAPPCRAAASARPGAGRRHFGVHERVVEELLDRARDAVPVERVGVLVAGDHEQRSPARARPGRPVVVDVPAAGRA